MYILTRVDDGYVILKCFVLYVFVLFLLLLQLDMSDMIMWSMWKEVFSCDTGGLSGDITVRLKTQMW